MASDRGPLLETASRAQLVPLRVLRSEGKTAISLQQAVRDGREEVVRKILDSLPIRKKNKVINARDPFGFTATHYAARFNRFTIMHLLYNEKADPNVTTDEGLTPLHYASRYTPLFTLQQTDDDDDEAAPVTLHSNNKRIMQLLVLWKVDVNVQDIYGITPLHMACNRGNHAAVEVLLFRENISVNIQDKQQDTPLHDACLLGDSWIVEQLLDKGADVLITNDENVLPIHVACQEGYTDIVNIMLRKRFDDRATMLSSYDNEYNYPLHLACRSGDAEIVKVLFLNNADPNVVKEGGLTPLHIAAREGFVEIAEVLLQYEGLDIDVRNDELLTPLHLAAKHNRVKMIEYLLMKGADIEAQDEDSSTPLLTAVAYGQKDAMETILKSKCAVDIVDRNGKSVVFIAAEENHSELLKSMLSGSVAEYCVGMLTTTDSTHNTPLHIACAKGNVESVKVLLRSEIKPDARNDADKTPLHLAATKGHVTVVKELIRHGKERKIDLISDEDDDSNTALHLACINGHYNVAKVLLESGADPDTRNARYWTPMDCAGSKGWDRIIQLLLEFEADIDPKDKAGITPLHLACKEGHLKCVLVLLENGAKVSNRNSYDQNALDIAVENGHKDVAMAIVKSNQMTSALRNRSPHVEKMITPMRRIINRMPEVAKEVFNRCAVTNEGEVGKDDPNYTVTLNYEFLEDFSEEDQTITRLARVFTRSNGNDMISDQKSDTDGTDEFVSVYGDEETLQRGSGGGFSTGWGPKGYDRSNHCLHLLVNSKSVELLKHPLVTSLLNYKWTAYGQMVYFTNLFIYLIFICFLTSFALTVLPPGTETCIEVRRGNSSSDICENDASGGRQFFVAASGAIVVIFAVVKLLFELFQFFKLGLKYFLDWINYIEIFLFVGSIIFAFIFTTNCFCPTPWQWQIGALSLFLGWIDLVIFMRKFPVTGIYVVMFIHIFYIFLKMAFLAALLILAFAFSFYMLFHNPENIAMNIRTPFQDPGRTIVKTMTMTTGEFEFDSIFRQGGDTGADIEYPVISYTLWILFLILMPILLTNLLVGLAVDDIKGIQENAELKRLSLRVELALSVEELLPSSLRRRFIIGERKIRPNRKLNMAERFWYNGLGFQRFDAVDKIINALHPPPKPIEEVSDQNADLAKKVNDMHIQLEMLNDKLAEMMETVTFSEKREHEYEQSVPKSLEKALTIS